MENHLEARLWNNIFVLAQQTLGVPQGMVKTTVLIETILAAYEMDEILYELRPHATGLNCGRWDYIFSLIKKFRIQPDFALPDRGTGTMTNHFPTSYSVLLIKTCHRCNAFAMGGMAAQIPIKSDADANKAALDKVREAKNGDDGTWVARPGLVGIAQEAFDQEMLGPNQLAKLRADVGVGANDLLAVPMGAIPRRGCAKPSMSACSIPNLSCVPLYNLMEDVATAEISRSQVWQWVHHGLQFDDGRLVDASLFETMLDEETSKIEQLVGGDAYAAALFYDPIKTDALADFLTLSAYD